MSSLAIHENKIYSLGDNAVYTIPTTILPPPTLWLRADAGVVKDGDNLVSEWQNQNGNNYHAEQGSHANKPLWMDNELNGKPILRFNGSSNYMKVLFSEVYSQPTTLFHVHKINTANTNQFIIDRHSSFHYLFFKGNASASVAMNAGSSLESTLDVPYNYHLFSNVFNGASSQFFINNILVSSGNTGNNSVNGLTLGARYSNNNFAAVDFAEIIFYNSLLSDPQRQSVENYLITKYAL